MTLEEQKLAVCEKLPELVSVIRPDSGCQFEPYVHWRDERQNFPLLNWPTGGLAVCQEAEKLLDDEERVNYAAILVSLLDWDRSRDSVFKVAHATYEQRLEALCRVWWPERFLNPNDTTTEINGKAYQ